MNGRCALGGLGLLALAATGCFDVNAVNPGPSPFVLDDFSDGDTQPNDPNFGAWACYTDNADAPLGTCAPRVSPGDPPALIADATIIDPMDGIQQNGGIELGTYAPLPEDLARFSVIAFSSKLESGSPPISSNAIASVYIGCSSVPGANGMKPSRLYVSISFNSGQVWTPARPSLRNFGWPSYVPPESDGGPALCLKNADSVRFSVDAALPDGTTGVFHFSIADVRFE